jgi:hypothetical protein
LKSAGGVELQSELHVAMREGATLDEREGPRRQRRRSGAVFFEPPRHPRLEAPVGGLQLGAFLR